MILQFAWRNIWRNRRRTGITLAAVAFTTAVLIASYGLMDGIVQQAVDSATNMVGGEAQIHAPGYRTDRSIYSALADPDALLARADEEGIGAAPRSFGFGLISHGTKSAGAVFWGVEPRREKITFDLDDHLASGDYLSDAPEGGMVLGKKLARSLDVAIGDELVVVVQAADGSLGNELYRVAGILKAAGEGLDRTSALMHRADFEELFVSAGRVHEIALNSRGRIPLEEIRSRMAPALGGEEFKTWQELLPLIADMLEFFDAAIWIFGSVFFLAGGLGVMNTMLMATYERIQEFGVLKALGTSPGRIIRDVAAEALMLGLLAAVLGSALGLGATYILQEKGIDTSSVAGDLSSGGVAFDPIWRATLSLEAVLVPTLTMWIICILAALYPAILASRLDPVEAMGRT